VQRVAEVRGGAWVHEGSGKILSLIHLANMAPSPSYRRTFCSWTGCKLSLIKHSGAFRKY
jgi:hypothetical protein